jgi:hypothetical protein
MDTEHSDRGSRTGTDRAAFDALVAEFQCLRSEIQWLIANGMRYQQFAIVIESYCQVLWIERDQAAAFFRFFCDSIWTPSSNTTPARTSGTSSAALIPRQ